VGGLESLCYLRVEEVARRDGLLLEHGVVFAEVVSYFERLSLEHFLQQRNRVCAVHHVENVDFVDLELHHTQVAGLVRRQTDRSDELGVDADDGSLLNPSPNSFGQLFIVRIINLYEIMS